MPFFRSPLAVGKRFTHYPEPTIVQDIYFLGLLLLLSNHFPCLLNRILVGFTRADPHRLFHRGDKDLAVTDFPGPSGFDDGVN